MQCLCTPNIASSIEQNHANNTKTIIPYTIQSYNIKLGQSLKKNSNVLIISLHGNLTSRKTLDIESCIGRTINDTVKLMKRLINRSISDVNVHKNNSSKNNIHI